MQLKVLRNSTMDKVDYQYRQGMISQDMYEAFNYLWRNTVFRYSYEAIGYELYLSDQDRKGIAMLDTVKAVLKFAEYHKLSRYLDSLGWIKRETSFEYYPNKHVHGSQYVLTYQGGLNDTCSLHYFPSDSSNKATVRKFDSVLDALESMAYFKH